MSAFLFSTAVLPSSAISQQGVKSFSKAVCGQKLKSRLSRTDSLNPIQPTAKVTLEQPSSARGENGAPKLVASIKTMEEFWQLADESKVNAQYEADSCISFLKQASLEEIRSICLQYRYFVERYPDNLSRLLSKMPNQQLKSLLSSILSEELGSGQIDAAHIVWYDRFLRSIGVKEEELETGIYDENEEILSQIEYRCNVKSFEHVVGMVGMGGECLCQIYLTVMYKNLRTNPVLKKISDKIDWEFWTYHVGEDDIEHRRLVRACIDEMVIGESGVSDLASGYSFGKGTWDKFWSNNFKNTRAGKM